MAKKDDIATKDQSTDIVYLTLGRAPVNDPNGIVVQRVDARDIAKLDEAGTKAFIDSAIKSVEMFEKDPWFDEVADVLMTLDSQNLERDGHGKVIMYPQAGRMPAPRQTPFDLKDQRFRNRMDACITLLNKDDGKDIEIEFHKNAKLDVPNYEDAVKLAELMHQSLNERTIINSHIPVLDDKFAEMGLKAQRMLDSKKG